MFQFIPFNSGQTSKEYAKDRLKQLLHSEEFTYDTNTKRSAEYSLQKQQKSKK